MPRHKPPSPPLAPSPPTPNRSAATTFSTHKALTTVASLSNLLPTGTVLAFQTLKPSFSNRGICQLPNKYLTIILITFCSINCFITSFTDSFIDSKQKLRFGIATFNGLHIFNPDNEIRQNRREGNIESMIDKISTDLSKFKIALIDFVHALVSLLVFLAFAFSDGDVKKCLLGGGGKGDWVVMNLPMVVGGLASVLFMIFPTVRRGIGYGEMAKRLN